MINYGEHTDAYGIGVDKHLHGTDAFNEYPRRAERWSERMWDDAGFQPIKMELPLFQYFATASVAFGISNRYEVLLAAAAHAGWTIHGNKGLGAIFSSLAGIQMQKGRFKTATLPTILGVYNLVNDFKQGRGMTKSGMHKIGWWALGYTCAMLKAV